MSMQQRQIFDWIYRYYRIRMFVFQEIGAIAQLVERLHGM